ncbi:MAG: sugar phosphate isomerase/epimerase [Bacteroidales bacterium]|nr:sugar phosphate isomerase/epimerase [Bacteroidales bacterium]
MKRRKFLNTTAAIAAGTVIPQVISCGSSKQPMGLNQERGASLDSKYGGVQIGAITYSFRDLKGGLESTLDACVKAGISSVELMGTGVEDYLGAPKNPVVRRSSQENPYTSEEKKMIEEYKSKIEEWRKSVGTPSLYARLRDEINKQGINVHIYKWVAGSTEEEIDYSFKVAKALGAIGISAEINESNARTLGPIAEENGMYAILHNHYQYAEPSFDVDKLLAYSPANMLNFDIGHYFGSTGLNPTDFVRDYHDRIASIHLKDKTSASNETEKNTNQVWGQGETPIAEVLHLIRDRKWGIYCDIELEYKVVPWSTSIKEVKTCKEYCRQILL